jgi:UDP-N-acetylglucosamine enolpyruvyl transferase
VKHNIAVHTFIDDERKAQFFEVAPHMATDDVLIKSENANAMQSWISKNEDFFFCHRVAKDEDDILQVLEERDYEKSFQTVCYELPGFISRYTGELDVSEVAKKLG